MHIFGNIEKATKQEDGTIIVEGYASSEAVDSDGEVIKSDAIKAAIPDYMKFANIREMHQAKAAGTALELEVQADGRTFIKAHIVAADAVKMVENKVYKGFSIGGRVTERDTADRKIIKGIKLSEISLVDRPANPEAVFTISKIDDAEEIVVPAEITDEAQKAAFVEGVKFAKAAIAKEAKDKADAEAAALEKAEKEKLAKAEEDKKAALKKGMAGVSWLASILDNINNLKQSTAWEAVAEGDNSSLPADVKAWLTQGGEILKDMVAEEVAELTADPETPDPYIILLSERVGNLVKAAFSAEDAEKFAKHYAEISAIDSLAKAGARHSSKDMKSLQAIHDNSASMGAKCATAKALGTEDLAKAADEITKLKTDNEELVKISETLAKRVKELEALPAPAKPVLRIVEKTSDANPSKAVDKSDVAKDGKEALTKVWAAGGIPA